MAGQAGASRPDGKSSNAAAIVGGLVALGAVLLVLVVSAGGSSKSAGSTGIASGGANGAAGLPAAPTQSTGAAAPTVLPRVAMDPLRQAQPVEDVAAEPDAHVDGLFSCHNMVEPLPIAWAQADADLAAAEAPAGTNAKALAATPIGRMWARVGTDLAPHRLTLSCRTADLRTIAVHAYFDAAVADALPAIGRHTDVLLQLIGVGPAGHLLARFVNVVGRPRDPALFRAGLPDLLAVLQHPQDHLGQQVLCLNARQPQVLQPAQVEAGVQDVFAPPELRGSVFLEVTCTDMRNVDIPVLALFTAHQAGAVLQVATGTVLALDVRGFVRNQPVTAVERLVSGGVEPAADDLRHLLLSPQLDMGHLVQCQSMGLPLAQTTDSGDPQTAGLIGAPLAPRKAWLVCQQPHGPPVSATLHLRAGSELELLRIKRGTQVQARLIGRTGDRLVLVLDHVAANAATELEQKGDLRRYVLQPTPLVGKGVKCQVGRTTAISTTSAARLPGHKLLQVPAVGAPVWLECLDSLRPFDGQRFEVWFASAAARDQALSAQGTLADLQFAGVVENLPVALWVGPAAAAPGP